VNRDTLYVLLNFLHLVAENSEDRKGPQVRNSEDRRGQGRTTRKQTGPR
jgi:hypothetical protein